MLRNLRGPWAPVPLALLLIHCARLNAALSDTERTSLGREQEQQQQQQQQLPQHAHLQQQQQQQFQQGRCQPIVIPMCLGIGYNTTRLPNSLGHEEQQEAAIKLHEFAPLVEYGCHVHLRFFLCSVYAPMCSEQVSQPIPACRPMCRAVRQRCAPVLEQFNFAWPDALDCARLPTRHDPSALCMEAPAADDDEGGGGGGGTGGGGGGGGGGTGAAGGGEPHDRLPLAPLAPPLHGGGGGGSSSSSHPQHTGSPNQGAQPPGGRASVPSSYKPTMNLGRGDDSKGVQPHPPPPRSGSPTSCENPSKFHYVERSKSCAPRCGPDMDVYWSGADKRFASVWLAVWSALCFASSAFTVLTFAIDSSRFQYPERPIIFLSMCYCLHSVAFLVRLFAGASSIACDHDSGSAYIIQAGLESTGCTLVFLLLYYFGMAASVWWVVLTFTWFLAAGIKWGHEAIEAKSSYFHLAAWALPAVQTIVILGLRKVAGEELTGLCYVGGLMSPNALAGFVIVPLTCYLILGTSFILAGLVALFDIRRVMRTGGTDTEKLEKLMVKIGVFSVLYSVPATCVIACYFYEWYNADSWRTLAVASKCRAAQGNQTPDCTAVQSIPSIEVYLLKVFMSLVVGITSGMWIWSSKTLQSWQMLWNKKLSRQTGRKGGVHYKSPSLAVHAPPGHPETIAEQPAFV
uniref:Frizzled-9-like n=2 Tax=Petromyzon marinus TaxID=7757 RepID=A0AAJ7SNU8_PETMA|nr:frizzled-9-like [Petromyzon marinus]